MFVYRGKLNYESYAVNEGITIVFSAGFGLGQPVSVIWQWTVDQNGIGNANASLNGIVDEVSLDEKTIGLCLDQEYRFEGTIGPGFESLTLTMHNVSNQGSSTVKLTLDYMEPASSPASHMLYMGKVDWYQYARNEVLLVIIPSSPDSKSTVCNYWQWTIDGHGVEKSNENCVVPLQVLEGGENGIIKLAIAMGYYIFEGETSNSRDTMMLTMGSPGGHKSPLMTLRRINGL